MIRYRSGLFELYEKLPVSVSMPVYMHVAASAFIRESQPIWCRSRYRSTQVDDSAG